MMNDLGVLLESVNARDTNDFLRLSDVRRRLSFRLPAFDAARADDQEAGQWDLLGADCDPDQEAPFLLTYFLGETATFLAGRATRGEVQAFLERTFAARGEAAFEELPRRFWVAGKLVFPLAEVRSWIEG